MAAETELLTDLQEITIGEYEIRGVLGRGGMGLVYLAQDISLNKKVAIKVLPPSAVQGEVSVERFRREARIAASLRHRNITSVFALRETTRLMFFVMEYVEGRTIDAILSDEQRLPSNLATTVLWDVASALSYAHQRDVVHRDLKPGNIMVDVEGMAMVMDFGLAKASRAEGLTASGFALGTPRYMSPDQWSGKATAQSDQYALGCVAYELIAGRAPFVGETVEELMRQHIYDTPQQLRELCACPPALAASVMRMLDKDPNRRWPSVDEAVAAMRLSPISPHDPARGRLASLAARGHTIRALPVTPKSPIPPTRIPTRRKGAPKRPPRLSRGWIALAAVVVGVGVGGYALVSGSKDVIEPIAIEGAPTTMAVGETVRLAVRRRTTTGGTVPADVVWSINDSSVGFVTSDGMFAATSTGLAALTASRGDETASVQIAVRPRAARVVALEVNPRGLRLFPGESLTLGAIATDSGGGELSGRPVQWMSSAPGVLSVSSQGTVIAVAPGLAVVSAASDGTRGDDTIMVFRPGPAFLGAQPALLSLPLGRTARLRAVVRDAKGRLLPGVNARWSSSDPAVATVSPAGDVTAMRAGTAKISAITDGLVGAPAVVNVTAPHRIGFGILRVMVSPWANLTIDGVDRGPLTRSADSLRAGIPHHLRFERAGYETRDTIVTLGSGELRTIQIQLRPRTP
jgi:serine/threonine-protein kinase